MRALIAETGESAGLSVRYDGPEIVRLDRVMMSRILLNLARHAANAGARSLSIDVWRAGRLGVMDIADDGPGIPEEERELVFRPFYRIDHARNQDSGSTGLGLAIARDIARIHGGDIKLDESSLGGLKAVLTLPV